jgi:multisubunit Na+/H+ antiporter MnhB subunit
MIGKRLTVLDEADRWLFRVLLLVSFYVMVRGHNAPGGGFAGGLVAGAAFVLRYLAGGIVRVRRSSIVNPTRLIGFGLVLSVVVAIVPILVGDPALSSDIVKFSLPLIGEIKVVSSSLFDVGVYFLVIGVVLTVLVHLGSDPLRERT